MNNRTATLDTIREIDGCTFRLALRTAQLKDNRIQFIKELAEYDNKEVRCFLSFDNRSGYAVRSNGEIISLFNLVRGRGNRVMISAVKNKGRNLSCLDGKLVPYYRQFGFKIVKIEANNIVGMKQVVYMELK